jgi:dTDP-4-amino-4,6-dideoxygalactose transaminase
VASATGGINAKMSELHAATALAALDNYDDVLQARRGHARDLVVGLEDHGFVFQPKWATAACRFLPTLAKDAATRNRIPAGGLRAGIELRTYYEPLHTMPAFAGRSVAGSMPVTDELGGRTLSLPMANDSQARLETSAKSLPRTRSLQADVEAMIAAAQSSAWRMHSSMSM